jgi:1,3-beta-glucan synthase
MKFDRVDWNRAFFKTYSEKRSFGHLLVNFNRIWVIHVAMYYFYTAFNSPNIYRVEGRSSPAMTWSAVALGGAVATIIMILATLAEFSYIPTTWNNTSHLTRRLIFLFITLGLTCGPTFYITIVEHNGTGGSLALILGIVQFFISVIATVLFSIMPSGRMFGDRVAGKSRKYLASQTFTASYPSLDKQNRIGSILLWVLVFGCKFTESYFFLTTSFGKPIQVMVGMKIQGCTDRFFSNALCTNQAAFTLTIMYIMDLVLFFLDTFLWYIIWNTVFSIARSFTLGLSIWTPWKDIYTRLPKRIYAKLLATQDMEVKYKPKVICHSFCPFYSEMLIPFFYVSRSSFRRSGTLLSFPCIANTCSPSTTFKNSFIIKSTRVLVVAAAFVRRLSSSLRMIRASRASFSLLEARPSGAFRSLHNL